MASFNEKRTNQETILQTLNDYGIILFGVGAILGVDSVRLIKCDFKNRTEIRCKRQKSIQESVLGLMFLLGLRKKSDWI